MSKTQSQKQKITKETAISELKQLFNIDSSEQSKEQDGVFHIHKSEFTREETVQKLLDYFKTREFVPGYQCAVEPMTFVWTVFKVVKSNDDKV